MSRSGHERYSTRQRARYRRTQPSGGMCTVLFVFPIVQSAETQVREMSELVFMLV